MTDKFRESAMKCFKRSKLKTQFVLSLKEYYKRKRKLTDEQLKAFINHTNFHQRPKIYRTPM